MPRCFLAKQSNSNSSDKRVWNSNEESEVPGAGAELRDEVTNISSLHGLHGLQHRSKVGSISAAEAVKSLQQPVRVKSDPSQPANKGD